MENDKLALRASNAGMRFIAQMTIFNSDNAERLRQFISDSYHDNLLAAQSVDIRLADFQALLIASGKMKVKQVVGTDKHRAVVIMETQQTDEFYYVELQVEEDYPHKIIHYLHAPLKLVEEE
jgi:hypothetical protein